MPRKRRFVHFVPDLILSFALLELAVLSVVLTSAYEPLSLTCLLLLPTGLILCTFYTIHS